MKLKKFLCLFLLIAAVLALASCDILMASLGTTTDEAKEEYTVKFDSRGGKSIAPQKVEEGEYVIEPKEPTRDGYKFLGWYCSGSEWDFGTDTVTSDMTLTAKWEKVSTHEHNFTGATCTQPGKCACGQLDTQPLGHSWTAATCTAPKTCTVCGDTEGTTIPHNITVVPGTSADCDTPGKTAGKSCTVCGAIIEAQEEIPATGHKPGAAATCTEAQTCTVCGDTLTEALGHNEIIDAAVAPSCETTGLTEGKHCDVCGETLIAQEEVPATGHAWDEGKVTTEPDCTNAGVKTYTCANDANHTKTESVDALGHTEVIDEAKEPGCDTTGLTEGKHCGVCGEILIAQEEVPAAGHKFVDGACEVCGKQTYHTVKYYINGEFVHEEEFTETEGLATLYAYSKPGYNFLGWTDLIDSVTSIPAGTAEDVELWGEIEAISYTITYIVNGETYTTASYTISDSEINLIEAPAVAGFNVCWTDSDGNTVTSIPAGTIGALTFTAKYDAISYSISYELNGGKNDVRNATSYSPAEIPELYAPESRDGYLFEGWYLNADFSGDVVTSLENVPAGDVTLYAKWKDVSGGTLTPEAPL